MVQNYRCKTKVKKYYKSKNEIAAAVNDVYSLAVIRLISIKQTSILTHKL